MSGFASHFHFHLVLEAWLPSTFQFGSGWRWCVRFNNYDSYSNPVSLYNQLIWMSHLMLQDADKTLAIITIPIAVIAVMLLIAPEKIGRYLGVPQKRNASTLKLFQKNSGGMFLAGAALHWWRLLSR